MKPQGSRNIYAIVCYLTFVGWLISISALKKMSNSDRIYVAFHLRQMLLLMLLTVAIFLVSMFLFFIHVLGVWLFSTVSLTVSLFWFYLILHTIQGEKKYLPLIGRSGERLLGDMFESI